MAIPRPNITIAPEEGKSVISQEYWAITYKLWFRIPFGMLLLRAQIPVDLYFIYSSTKHTKSADSRYITREVSIKGKYRASRYKTFVKFHLAFQTSEYSRSSINSQSRTSNSRFVFWFSRGVHAITHQNGDANDFWRRLVLTNTLPQYLVRHIPLTD